MSYEPYHVNQVIHGFRVTSVQEGDEPNGRAVRMIHEATGAELFWLDNQAGKHGFFHHFPYASFRFNRCISYPGTQRAVRKPKVSGPGTVC